MDMQPEVLEYLETYGAGFDVLFQLTGCALAKAGTNVAEVNIGEEHHAIGVRAAFDDRESEDRKSTRLNSSHRTISYAVFCLKKKTDLQLGQEIKPPTHPRQDRISSELRH